MKYQYISKIKIKFFLVFFCALVLTNCADSHQIAAFKIHYENGKAASISFTSKGKPDGYAVFVKGVATAPILGEFGQTDEKLVFEPIIPFSNGQAYEIRRDSEPIFEFTIAPKVASAAELLAIYPSRDTVPENLLKMYFVFSKPMQEVGRMLDNIKVYNKTDGREESIFLALENELWNKEHTQLTLWLDPGRIKRDLIPNQEKGLPIEKGKIYEVTVSPALKDADGIPMDTSYSKTFYVAARDTHSPKIRDWDIQTPAAGTMDVLTIDFKEPLDAILAKETFQVATPEKQSVTGKYRVVQNESELNFYPDSVWTKGNYKIIIDPILEDLAGNNLDRLFDENLSRKTASIPTSKAHIVEFIVRFLISKYKILVFGPEAKMKLI